MTNCNRRRWASSSRELIQALSLVLLLGVSWFLPAALWAGECGMAGCGSCCCCCQAPDSPSVNNRATPQCCDVSDAEGQIPPATEAESPQRLAGDFTGLAHDGDVSESVTDVCWVVPEQRSSGLSPPALYLRLCSFLI